MRPAHAHFTAHVGEAPSGRDMHTSLNDAARTPLDRAPVHHVRPPRPSA